MRIFFFMLLLLLSEYSVAVGNWSMPRFLFNTFNLRISPLSLVDFYSGACYKFGLECKVYRAYAITVEYGGYVPVFKKYANIKGSIINVGIRRYFWESDDHNGGYFSLNYQYKEQSFVYRDNFKSTSTYSKDYSVQKYVNCVNFNIGACAAYERSFVVDVYAGAGIRLKRVNSSVSLEELRSGEEYSGSPALRLMVKPGSFILPDLNIGIRVGLLLSSQNRYAMRKTKPKFQ
jgi:hypothetical protein